MSLDNEMILHLIRKGSDAVFYFTYDGNSIPFRPLRSIEMDDAKINSLEFADTEVISFVIDIRLGKIDDTLREKLKTPDFAHKFAKYTLAYDYWIVYHATKDFMPKDYSINDVRNMHSVHDFANRVLSYTTQPNSIIVDVISTEKGKELCKFIVEFRVPLVDAEWKLTPLQHKFIKYANGDKPVLITKTDEEMDALIPSLFDVFRG